MSTTEKDRGWRRIQRELKRAQGAYLEVGHFADESYPDGPSVGDIAVIHEFGAPQANIPARPFHRNAMDGNRGEHFELMERLYGRLLGGDIRINRALTIVAARMTRDIAGSIRDLSDPPLAESTKRRKASTIRGKKKRASFLEGPGNPLIETGLLRHSVSFKIHVDG